MSLREMRSFTETMRCLGYPRLISMDNFRVPNFELVADCLHWLVQRFYPECDISDDISTESARVAFLQAVAHVMLSKTRMKLHIRRLYAADGAAVKELLKIAALLHKATLTATLEDEDGPDAPDLSTSMRSIDVRALHAAGHDAVRAGAALHAALGREPELRDARARALAGGGLDAGAVEAAVGEAAAGVEEGLRALASSLQELAEQEGALEAKLDKRRGDLERAEKRLAALAGVRPAYMDEYEALSGQLQGLYAAYLERHRNLEYLEARLAGYRAQEQEGAEAADKRLRKMQRRLAEEELRILRGEQEVDEARIHAASPSDSGSDDDQDTSDQQQQQQQQRGQARGQALARAPQGWGGAGVRPGQQRDQGRRDLQQQEAAAVGQVVGSLGGGAGWEDDASIDEDSASDGGAVSMAGSERHGANGAYEDNAEGDGILDDDGDGDESDDSGF